MARGSYPHVASHIIGHTDHANDKIAVTKAPICLLESALYILLARNCFTPRRWTSINRLIAQWLSDGLSLPRATI